MIKKMILLVVAILLMGASMGIVEGCHQNGISSQSITDALKRTRQEVGREKPSHKKTKVSR